MPQCTTDTHNSPHFLQRDNADLGPPTVTRCCGTVDRLQIVRLAQHPIIQQRKLLTGGQLTAAHVAREAGQMEDQLAGTTHPIRRRYAAAAFRTFGAKVSAS